MTEKQKAYHKEYSKKYYQEHKEYFKEKQKEWRDNNPEKWRETVKRNRNKRVERLIAQGCINPWSVVIHGYDPKYEMVK